MHTELSQLGTVEKVRQNKALVAGLCAYVSMLTKYRNLAVHRCQPHHGLTDGIPCLFTESLLRVTVRSVLWSAEPPVTRMRLVELYRKRYALLRARGWRGDRYMALLDAARARELAPMEAQPRWE